MTSQHPILHAPTAGIAAPAPDVIAATRGLTRNPLDVDLFCPWPAHGHDAGKAPNAAAHIKGNTDFSAQWAVQSAPLARASAAAALIATSASDFAEAAGQSHSHSMPRITK